MEESNATGESDIYQQVVDRYGESVAPQHRNLRATAKEIQSIIISKSMLQNPLSYFDTIIKTLSDTCKTTRDADLVAALSLLLEFVLSLVSNNKKFIDTSKAANAVLIVVEGLRVSNVRALVECLETLLELCDLDDWESVKSGFSVLIEYSRDKRPQVREDAQDCVLKLLKSFQSDEVKTSACELVLKSLGNCLEETTSKLGSTTAEYRLVVEGSDAHNMLQLLEVLIPSLPTQVMLEAITLLKVSVSTQSSLLTEYTLNVMVKMLEFFESESESETLPMWNKSDGVVEELVEYNISVKWKSHYSQVIASIAGVLTHEGCGKRASVILSAMIKGLDIYGEITSSESDDKSIILKSLCDALFVKVDGPTPPNDHCLAVICQVFRELGENLSYIYMWKIVEKLVGLMPDASDEVKHCIGCAIADMGPETIQGLIPISVDVNASTCSNTWLIPLFKNYVVGSSLGYFMETIMPLANSFETASQNVTPENPEISRRLKEHARDCRGLLPAFSRYPCDMHEVFEPLLVNFMISNINEEDTFMLENVAIALQYLVKQYKNMSFLGADEASRLWESDLPDDIITRDIKVLSQWSEELLKAFIKVFFHLSPDKHRIVTDTIGCLALVTEASTVKAAFVSSLEKMPLGKNCANARKLASVFVGAASIDPDDYIYNSIKERLQEGHEEAYAALCKMMVESEDFMPLRFMELLVFLLHLKPCPTIDSTSLESRLLCISSLFVYSIKVNRLRENKYCCHMLRQIIEPLNSPDEKIRQVAVKIVVETKSILLTTSSSFKTGGLYYEYINMIIWLLYESSDVKCNAVTALTLLINGDKSEILLLVPDVMPAILHLLDNEANILVINAVLGFIGMLVVRFQERDLQNFLSDILYVLLPWSSVSQHDVKCKVTFILETMRQKFDYELVKSHVPEKYRDFVEKYFGVTK